MHIRGDMCGILVSGDRFGVSVMNVATVFITKEQARRFLLRKHGLIGEYIFAGKDGVCEYVRQTGCIQFDPVDACGKNAELTLQSRVKGFRKSILYELLYEDRRLIDYPDKNLAIMPVEDWAYFARYREAARKGGENFPELPVLEEYAKKYISENGPVSSDELPIEGNMHWHSFIHWSGNWHGQSNAARSVLEQLYSVGELVIHHKKGTRKYYDLTEKHIPEQIRTMEDPIPDEFEHLKWRIYRRIGAVGLLWNRPSDAWLNIWGLTAADRTKAFEELMQEEKIIKVQVEGLKTPLYCQISDYGLVQEIIGGIKYKPRCEFIAALDPFLWDRKLIQELFGYEYTWEIYTPAAKRKYGYYVLPILYGEQFAGRIEAVNDSRSGKLIVKNIWYEEGVRHTKKLKNEIEKAIRRLSKFNVCCEIEYQCKI